MEFIKLPLRYRGVLATTVIHSLKQKYIASVLGLFWLLLYPLLFLALYAIVFVMILNVRVPDLATQDYILLIFSGLIPFLAFSESFGTGVNSIASNGSLLKNMMFPIELIPMRDVVVGHVSMGVGLLLVVAACFVLGFRHETAFLVPVVYALQNMMTIGVVWFFATLNVFFRDIGNLVPIITLSLMLVSPIAYTSDMVPEAIRSWIYVNPLAVLMDVYRALLMEGVIPFEMLGLLCLMSLSTYFLGFQLIRRLKPLFADYV